MLLLVVLIGVLTLVGSLDLVGEPFSANGIEAIYQFPNKLLASIPPVGMIFLAHGCSHSATDWWPKSSTCPTCIGLPVETSIISQALSRNFAVIAMSSSNRDHKCWSPPDISRVTSLLKQFYATKLKDDSNIPLHLLGASSGGAFVGFLAQSPSLMPKASSLCVQISSVHLTSPNLLPPTIFLLMERDRELRMRVAQLQLSGNKVLLSSPKPISSNYFHDHSAGKISQLDSSRIVEALTEGGFVDKASFHLTRDPRTSTWREAVRKAVPDLQDSLVADASGISELLNLAWGYHEISDEHMQDVLTWFETNRSPIAH